MQQRVHLLSEHGLDVVRHVNSTPRVLYCSVACGRAFRPSPPAPPQARYLLSCVLDAWSRNSNAKLCVQSLLLRGQSFVRSGRSWDTCVAGAVHDCRDERKLRPTLAFVLQEHTIAWFDFHVSGKEALWELFGMFGVFF